MIRKYTLLLLAVSCFLFRATAQHTCGTDVITAQRLAAEPGFANAVQQYDANWAALQQNLNNALIINTTLGPVYEIPVVIHVIHTGGAIGSNYNPSVAQLTGMITYLNQTYAATYPGYPDTLHGGTRFPIQFTLAKRDPQCNATTGIERIDGSAVTNYVTYGVKVNNAIGATDAAVKALSDWPNNDYYNIWVVNKIDGWDGYSSGSGVVGYAELPPATPTLDGTIMMAAFAKSGENTLPHEIGHAFSLYHTFQGGSTTTCPPNANCATQNDLICDTDPQKQTFSCDTTQINTCTNAVWGSQLYNMMGYSSCPDRFTPGQRTRFINGLNTYRLGLVSSLGSVAPGATPIAAACTPSITATTNTFDAGIYKVVFNDMTAVTNGGYNDDGASYLDRTCRQQANVVAGTTYSISVKTGPNPEYVRVWIDYNNDGAFTASELVFSSTGTTGNQTQTGNITIPTTGVTTCTPIRMRVTSDRITAAAPTACGPNTYGQTEDYAVRITGQSGADTATIALTAGTNPSCINTPLTFTETTTGTVTTITRKWFVNGVATGVTAATYSSSTLANGSVVTSRIYYTGPCGSDSATSNAITVVRQTNVTPTVSIALTSGSNPGCPGQPLTFTATPVNGGTAPTYVWKVNGVAQAGITGNTFTTSTLTNGNTVSAVLTSNSPCASVTTANSNTITFVVSGSQTATDFIFLQSGTNPTCAGKPLTFKANVTNGGTAPVFEWLVNGSIVPGANTTTFTTSSLNNGDSIQSLMISNSPCVANPAIFSNVIHLTVIPNDTVKVASAITRGSNPGCKDSLLQFTATGINGGAAPVYAWFVNGTQVSAGATYTSTLLNSGDVVTVRMIATGAGCRVNDTAYSAPITLTISVTPAAPVISFIGTMLVSDSANVQWYGPGGIIAGATSQTYHPTVAGSYYALALNNGCASGKSNILLLSLLSVGQYNLAGVHISPNPTSGQLLIDWGSNPSTTRISIYTPSGQVVLRDVAENAFRKTLDLSSLSNGVYFVVLQDESGKAGTVRIVVAK